MLGSLGKLVGTLGVSAIALGTGAAVIPGHGGGEHGSLMYLTTESGVAVVDEAGRSTFSAPNALPTGDWSEVVTARPVGANGTVVEAVDPATGAVRRSQTVDGTLEVRAVARSGDLVVLMAPEHEARGEVYRPESRAHTDLVVVRLDGSPPRTIGLDANVEPEAFSTDLSGLFVVQYSPPLNPDRYRVRRLDLTTGVLGDVYTTDKELQGDMRGTPHTQALASDGAHLFTLYTKPNHEAFVHVLGLDGQFANCVDLPEGFARRPDAVAITSSPDGRWVFVVDAASQRVARVDVADLTVRRADKVESLPSARGPVVATATRAGLFVASGRRIVQLGGAKLATLDEWSVATPVRAVHVGSAGTLIAASRDRITTLWPRSKATPSVLRVHTTGDIIGIADGLPVTAKDSVQCAC